MLLTGKAINLNGVITKPQKGTNYIYTVGGFFFTFTVTSVSAAEHNFGVSVMSTVWDTATP